MYLHADRKTNLDLFDSLQWHKKTKNERWLNNKGS